jgi:hypothetical protein
MTMCLSDWEKRVLDDPGAPERVAEIEAELRLALAQADDSVVRRDDRQSGR